jgi:hypothetical protein
VNWTAINQDTVEVTWVSPKSDGGSEILEYIIRMLDDAGNVVRETTVAASLSIARLDFLPAGSSLTFAVAALNAAGEGVAGVASGNFLSPVATPTATPVATETSMTPVPTATFTATPTAVPAVELGELEITGSERQLRMLADAVSRSTGVQAQDVGTPFTVFENPSEIILVIPITEGQDLVPSGPLEFSVGKLVVQTIDGAGNASVRMDNSTRLLGAAQTTTTDEGLVVTVSDLRMFISRSDLVYSTLFTVDFEVEVVDSRSLRVPQVTLLTPDDLGEIADAVAEIPGLQEAIFAYRVTGGPDNVDLGSNRAHLSVSSLSILSLITTRWIASGSPVSIVKISENGDIHVEDADCDFANRFACEALFEDEANGFSTFVMAIGDVSETESVTPGLETPQPVPTATPGNLAPTATPLPLPTVALIPNDGGGGLTDNLPLWITIGVIGFFVVSGSVAAGRIVWKSAYPSR